MQSLSRLGAGRRQQRRVPCSHPGLLPLPPRSSPSPRSQPQAGAAEGPLLSSQASTLLRDEAPPPHPRDHSVICSILHVENIHQHGWGPKAHLVTDGLCKQLKKLFKGVTA